jgi:hypothetical protein
MNFWKRKEATVIRYEDDGTDPRQDFSDPKQWTLEELQRIDDQRHRDVARKPPNYIPRDLDAAPPKSPPETFRKKWHRGEDVRPEPAPLRDVDAITADLRANEKRIVQLEADLSEARVKDVDLRGELGETLDEIEKLAKDARKKYNLEAPNVQQPPPGASSPADDPGSPVCPPSAAPAGASESIHDSDPRFTPVPHKESGDDEIPF